MIDQDVTRLMNRAMVSPATWCVAIRYRDAKGRLTSRTISPIRWTSAGVVLALCLGRSEPRQFDLRRMSDVRLVAAADVLMGEGVECERVSVDGVSKDQADQRQ